MKMRKMEQEMEEVFEMKVQEKLQKLKDIEADVSVGRRRSAQRVLGGRDKKEGVFLCFDTLAVCALSFFTVAVSVVYDMLGRVI